MANDWVTQDLEKHQANLDDYSMRENAAEQEVLRWIIDNEEFYKDLAHTAIDEENYENLELFTTILRDIEYFGKFKKMFISYETDEFQQVVNTAKSNYELEK